MRGWWALLQGSLLSILNMLPFSTVFYPRCTVWVSCFPGQTEQPEQYPAHRCRGNGIHQYGASTSDCWQQRQLHVHNYKRHSAVHQCVPRSLRHCTGVNVSRGVRQPPWRVAGLGTAACGGEQWHARHGATVGCESKLQHCLGTHVRCRHTIISCGHQGV